MIQVLCIFLTKRHRSELAIPSWVRKAQVRSFPCSVLSKQIDILGLLLGYQIMLTNWNCDLITAPVRSLTTTQAEENVNKPPCACPLPCIWNNWSWIWDLLRLNNMPYRLQKVIPHPPIVQLNHVANPPWLHSLWYLKRIWNSSSWQRQRKDRYPSHFLFTFAYAQVLEICCCGSIPMLSKMLALVKVDGLLQSVLASNLPRLDCEVHNLHTNLIPVAEWYHWFSWSPTLLQP